MNASLSWIKAYVPDLDVTAQEFCDAMTLSGTKVEGFVEKDKNLDKIYVGQILTVEKHPDADKLVICQVDIGTRTLQIVTGAPNVAAGAKVPVVLDGGRVAGGHDGGALPENGIPIEKGKLRGVESDGMMCSIEELGSDKAMYPDAPENGLYIFPEDTQVGADAVEVLGLHDAVYEFEITSNRVDCYSVIGIAREAAATFRKPFFPPRIYKTGNEEKASDYLQVEVADPDLCPRYMARVVKNVKIAPSPAWLQRRLASCGIRPINNLVDITNYIMEEYGQPMHAFDYDLLAGHTIRVARAQEDQTFVTLDGQTRKLDNSILMINDGEKPVAIAGIMGGENSMITETVKTMVFESACFDGTNVRLSAKKLGLRTDASGKFEKGLDPENCGAAIDRACQLIEELGAGEVVGGAVDVYSTRKAPVAIPFDPDFINGLLGTSLSADEMLAYFPPLEVEYKPATRLLHVPSFRQDLLCKADIAEEVARFYGYDNIPMTLPTGEATMGGKSLKNRIEDLGCETAEYAGFNHAMTYSFESPKVFDKLLLSPESPLRRAVTIQNPLGEDFSIMRTTTMNGMLTSLATNYNRRNKGVKLYELTNVYIPHEVPAVTLPDERMHLTFGMYGAGDFFHLKGVIEEYLDKLGMKKKPHYDPLADIPYLHPGRKAEIFYEGISIGYLGEIHPTVAETYGIGERPYVGVLEIDKLVPLTTFDRKYVHVARYPAVTRDLSMVMKKEILVGQIEAVLEKKGGNLLETYQLFDVYEGSQITAGYKSVAYALTFRAKDRTLSDQEVNDIMNEILKGLDKLGVSLRK